MDTEGDDRDVTPRTPLAEYVDLPWSRARIIELVNVATPHHHPSIELLEFEDGHRALRFVAYYEGKPVEGPLVIEEHNLIHVARGAGRSKAIHSILKLLVPEVHSGWVHL